MTGYFALGLYHPAFRRYVRCTYLRQRSGDPDGGKGVWPAQSEGMTVVNVFSMFSRFLFYQDILQYSNLHILQ